MTESRLRSKFLDLVAFEVLNPEVIAERGASPLTKPCLRSRAAKWPVLFYLFMVFVLCLPVGMFAWWNCLVVLAVACHVKFAPPIVRMTPRSEGVKQGDDE